MFGPFCEETHLLCLFSFPEKKTMELNKSWRTFRTHFDILFAIFACQTNYWSVEKSNLVHRIYIYFYAWINDKIMKKYPSHFPRQKKKTRSFKSAVFERLESAKTFSTWLLARLNVKWSFVVCKTFLEPHSKTEYRKSMNNYTTASYAVAPKLFIQTSYWKSTWTTSRQLIKDGGHRCRTRLQEASILFSHAESRFLTLWDGEIRGTVGICSAPSPVGRNGVLWLREAREDVWIAFHLPSLPLSTFRPVKKTSSSAEVKRSPETPCYIFVLQDKHTSGGSGIDEFVGFLLLFAVKRFREPVGIRRPWRIWSEFTLCFSFSSSSCPTFLHFTHLHGWVKSVKVNKMLVEPFVFPGIDQTNQ